MSGPGGHPESSESLRLAAVRALADTPRRREVRRLAAAMREVIEHLVSTTASTEDLARAADELERLAGALAELPGGQTYQGFAETAMAGGLASLRERFPGSSTDLVEDDPERFAFFDHSPFIGLANPLSPPMDLVSEADRVVGSVVFGSAYEGPPGCVHGGYVAAAFDELLGAAQSLSGTQGMTAHLGVDYRSPTPLHAELRLEGRVDRHEGRKIWTTGTVHAGDRLCAEARALFIAFDPGGFQALLQARDPEPPPT